MNMDQHLNINPENKTQNKNVIEQMHHCMLISFFLT